MQMKQVAPKAAGPELFDPTRCNCLALRQAARHVSQIYDRHLAKVGLRGTQYSILSKLSRLGALPIGRLAEALVLDRTALGRALRPLERARVACDGTRECAPLVPEQFALGQIDGDRAAVENDQGAVHPRALFVDGVGENVFA